MGECRAPPGTVAQEQHRARRRRTSSHCPTRAGRTETRCRDAGGTPAGPGHLQKSMSLEPRAMSTPAQSPSSSSSRRSSMLTARARALLAHASRSLERVAASRLSTSFLENTEPRAECTTHPLDTRCSTAVGAWVARTGLPFLTRCTDEVHIQSHILIRASRSCS
jgi:hypothetical protein